MKIFISTLLFLLSTLSLIAVDAQNISVETQSTRNICKQDLFEKIENSYNRRLYHRSESLEKAERELKEFIANCADYSWHYQAEEYLRIVQEELAEQNFLVARFYWDRFQKGEHKSPSGAIFRLRKIIEEYPNYSQIILVKHLLDEAKGRVSQ